MGADLRPSAPARATPRRGAVVAWVVAAVLAIATWLYIDLQRELKSMARSTLRSLVDAQVIVLDTWVQEKQLNVQRWAADPRIVELTERAIAAIDDPAIGIARCRDDTSPALQALIEQLRSGEVANAANLVDAKGRIVAARMIEHCGLALRSERFEALAPVFAGATAFSPPLSDTERVEAERRDAPREPLVWVSAPVKARDGRVIAVLNVGKNAADRFSRVLAVARLGAVGEAYAFDARGRLLSESRYREALEGRGALAAGASSILSVRIESPTTNGEQSPLTLLVERALSDLKRGTDSELAGEVLTPYDNYVGASVVGAWRWLPAYGFGVAVEIGKDEVYAPLRRLEWTVSSAWVVAGTVLLALALATMRIGRLRRERDEARQVGNYELLEEIGVGGMARVYRARHRLLKRPVAVKIIELRHATDENLARFEREARLAGQLMHPNTVAIFDYGHTPESQLFYAMELLDGLTVQQLLDREGGLPAARVAHILHGIAGSLSEAHERGLVHRDIKPGNVMVCRRGDDVDIVKVLDFGLVKNVGEPETRNLTKSLRILGTPAYLAPERIDHPEGSDHRSDLYSLGAVGYFMLTGRPPYDGDDPLSLAYRIVHAPVPTLQSANRAELDPELVALIEACLAKDPQARPQSAREIIDALDRILSRTPWTAAAARSSWRDLRSDDARGTNDA